LPSVRSGRTEFPDDEEPALDARVRHEEEDGDARRRRTEAGNARMKSK